MTIHKRVNEPRGELWQSSMCGDFDQVWVVCPACKKQTVFRSEAGIRSLDDYSLEDAPLPVLVDLTRHAQACNHCGTILKLKIVEQPKMEVMVIGEE